MSRPSCLVITGPKTLPQLQNLPSALRSPRELTDNTEEGFTIRVCPDRKLLAKARPPESPFSSSSQTGCHKVPWGQINTADPQKKRTVWGFLLLKPRWAMGRPTQRAWWRASCVNPSWAAMLAHRPVQ